MLNQVFNKLTGTTPKTALSIVIIVANAIGWFFYSFKFLLQTISSFSAFHQITILSANLIGITTMALLSAHLIKRLNDRISFLYYWMFSGIFLSALPLIISINSFFALLSFALLTGAYFGLGMPICLGYFASATEASNRAKMGGITFLFTFIGYSLLLALANLNDIVLASIALSLWKAGALGFLFLLKPNHQEIDRSDNTSYSSALKKRSFLLYFIPWLMFSVINVLAPSIEKSSAYFSKELLQIGPIGENVLAAALALVFGFFADSAGRKRLIVLAFAALGLGYAFLGFYQNDYTLFFYYVTDGIAWGAFYTIFILTLWGDLAQGGNSEKYYALGSLPYISSNFLGVAISSIGISIPIVATSIFSFSSLFLFLAVLPLFYAPETLSDRIMKQVELKNYLEKAQKLAKKQTEKCSIDQKEDETEMIINPELLENQTQSEQDEDEAMKLAEQCY